MDIKNKPFPTDNVGVTGSREGWTYAQEHSFLRVISVLPIKKFHHGCCKGVDVQAAMAVTQTDFHCQIIGHPPTVNKYVVHPIGLNDVLMPPKPYTERDRDIVNMIDYLIAIPRTYKEQFRSGTWYTVNYARTVARIPLNIIQPNGTLIAYNFNTEPTGLTSNF